MTETVNDKDGYVSNFWRAVQVDPETVARWADWPVNENDLHARHSWLVAQKETLRARLEGNPDFYDLKIAGWWVWGICAWIGSGWCSGNGPWTSVDGLLVNTGEEGGINRQRPHLGRGQGINRQLPHLGTRGQGIAEWFIALQHRLRDVRVCSGDWSRICGPTPTEKLGLTGVFLDPPYSTEADRDDMLYTEEDLSVAHDVREWAIANGDNPLLRIALCGYDTEHAMPGEWTAVPWKTQGGYGNQSNQSDGRGRSNAGREVVWFSPHCLAAESQGTLDFSQEAKGVETRWDGSL